MSAPTTLQYSALGTEWTILIDAVLSQHDQAELLAEILSVTDEFDQRCSRFIPTSEACSFRDASPGTHQVSQQFAELLRAAQELKSATNGAYDPAVGGLLELTGYDSQYSFSTRLAEISNFQLPEWSIIGQALTIDGGVVFDIGGIGKGYWIDQLAAILSKAGHDFFLVDGGGDMFGTSKQDGSGWQIALEWPGDSTKAIGQIEVLNQGIAISDVYKRAWSQWHHLLEIERKRPTQEVRWAAAVAPTAWEADQATAALSLAWKSGAQLAREKGWQYAFLRDKGLNVSKNWQGTWFGNYLSSMA